MRCLGCLGALTLGLVVWGGLLYIAVSHTH
jgi:hypothetical protein